MFRRILRLIPTILSLFTEISKIAKGIGNPKQQRPQGQEPARSEVSQQNERGVIEAYDPVLPSKRPRTPRIELIENGWTEDQIERYYNALDDIDAAEQAAQH